MGRRTGSPNIDLNHTAIRVPPSETSRPEPLLEAASNCRGRSGRTTSLYHTSRAISQNWTGVRQ